MAAAVRYGMPMMMTRIVKWETNLDDTIKEWKNKQFQWGEVDCCKFILACEYAITGNIRNAKQIYELKYTSKDEAQAAIESIGYNDFIDYVDKNYQRKNKYSMRRGDIGLITIDGNHSLVINTGSHYAGMGEKGIVFFRNPKHIIKSWQI